MNQTRPLFVIKRYREILAASLVIESVDYFVSLTDTIIAGNFISKEALTAVGLVSPILLITLFITSIINSGTMLEYSGHVGRSEKDRANQYFSQGVIMAVTSGFVLLVIFSLIRDEFIKFLEISPLMNEYVRDYYNIIIFYCALTPLSYLLDYTVTADGGEKLSAFVNTLQIIGNIIFSIILAKFYGVSGIAWASLIFKLVYIVLICLHFVIDKSELKFYICLKLSDCLKIFQSGITMAYASFTSSLMNLALNKFAVENLDANTVPVVVIIEKLISLSNLFLGLSTAMRPVLVSLRGENNTKSMRYLMRSVCFDMVILSGIISLVIYTFAPYLANIFGIYNGAVFHESIRAVRIISTTIIFQAVMIVFFCYYTFIDKNFLAVTIATIKDFICPFSLIFLEAINLYVSLALAQVISMIICALIIYFIYGRERFPFLLPVDNDEKIFIYDFELDEKNAALMSKSAYNLLQKFEVPQNIITVMSACIEDILLLIREKNQNKILNVECNIILDSSGAGLIIRDKGIIFDITDSDSRIDSFRQYIVSNIITVCENKAHILTTGYNRNEFYFA
ncbi:MAG: hypothetical protein IJS99_04920 [Synergistaceae bacterium]|nr:hypothetical protein [Synergistaceae bacterium]